MKHLITAAMVLIFSQHSFGDKQGRYCELEGAYTEDGRAVSGEFFMYSDTYGEADGARTEDGQAVYGECYRYSDDYCELEGAYTEDGRAVSGECYIY
jgi:hypothetical protein